MPNSIQVKRYNFDKKTDP